MVVQVFALHRILDLDEILASDVVLIVDGFAQESQQSHLAGQRSGEQGHQDSQDGDVQDAAHDGHCLWRVDE